MKTPSDPKVTDSPERVARGSLRRMVSWHIYDGGFWLRIGERGRGFAISDKIKHPPLFSERYGHRRVYRIGKWGFEILKSANDPSSQTPNNENSQA
jgi:hypothetical protein